MVDSCEMQGGCHVQRSAAVGSVALAACARSGAFKAKQAAD